MLRNSVPYNGRAGCMRCRWCVGFACEVDAKCGTQNTVIPTALATGTASCAPSAIVKEILMDDRGRATGVAYFDAHDRLQEQPADLVVVSGAAIESARLLLNSKSRLFPNGLGNRYDWVGRNLQGHTYTGATGLFDFDTYDDLGPGASIAICDYNHGNPGLRGGAMLANEFIRLPYPLHESRGRPTCPALGPGRTRISCASSTSAPSRCRARRRRCRSGTRASRSIPRSGPLGHSGGAAVRRRATRTRSRSATRCRAKRKPG